MGRTHLSWVSKGGVGSRKPGSTGAKAPFLLRRFDAALKRRSSTSLCAARWHADPVAYASILFATSDAADDPVEERPFKGRVACGEEEPAFRPCVPFWNSPQRLVTSLTDNARPSPRPSPNGLRPH